MSWLALLLAVVLSVGFASCDKDDDEDNKPDTEADGGREDLDDSDEEAVSGGIVGTWRYEFSTGYITMTFNANGTGREREVDYADGNHSSNFFYFYDEEEGTIYIEYDDEEEGDFYDIRFAGSDVMYLDGERMERQ